MNVDALFALLEEARCACGHRDYVVIGSLSVLGLAEVATPPPDMTMSIDVDCWTRHDPPRAFDLQPALGEGSSFHRTHGIFLDPVSPRLPTLPEGWEARLLRLARGEVVAWFLEPHDAAVSKLARGEPRDLRWVSAGLRAGILAAAVIELRMRSTSFLDDAEQARAAQLLREIRTSSCAPGKHLSFPAPAPAPALSRAPAPTPRAPQA